MTFPMNPFADEVLNPVTGCSPVSMGCDHCYARREFGRLRAKGVAKYDHDFEDVRVHLDAMLPLRRWQSARRVLLPSMGDLFHDAVPDEAIMQVFDACVNAPKHLIHLLTKRPKRMAAMAQAYCDINKRIRMPENMLWGVSAETQQHANDRIPVLFNVPAHSPEHYWLSLEPLLSPVRLRETYRVCPACGKESTVLVNHCPVENAGIPRIGWVVVGCEVGTERRATDIRWAQAVVWDCRATIVPVFVKQLDTGAGVTAIPDMDEPCRDMPFPEWGCGRMP